MNTCQPVNHGIRARKASHGLIIASLLGMACVANAATDLADQPLFTNTSVPGNLALALSVEFPTVVRTAHTGTYSSASTFLGYFDPAKCYQYQYYETETAAQLSHFYPVGLATNRVCSGTQQWSGNFLNWATMQAIDPFRWALTGGYRIVDTETTTILQKARHSGQGLFPDKSVSSGVSGATPFGWANFNIRIEGMGIRMKFTGSGSLGDAGSHYNPAVGATASQVRWVNVRVKVCDSSAAAGGVESNCRQYSASNWKPEGLIQRYANQMRFSAFGYLNDDAGTRDGGVLRAAKKFVGPIQPVPGLPAVNNPAREWDPATGIFVVNPDGINSSLGINISNSGVINYLNKFGQLNNNNYKSLDPVSELYYAVQRYYRNLGNVPEYTNVPAGTANATRERWADGFPVITDWTDPIQYSCQRNFILGIGDIYTHRDKNVPGRRAADNQDEPALPALVSSDTTVNARLATNKVGELQGLSNTLGEGNSYSGRSNSAFIAGLAYLANTQDIRSDIAGRQTIQTYWVDVLEAPFVANNQFYLAAKYGGFRVPNGFDPYARTEPLPTEWWASTTDTVGTQRRPDNYFTAGRPDTMVAGLNQAFANIAAQLRSFTTSFSTSLPQVSTTGNASFSAQFDAETWVGEIVASELSFNPSTGEPTLQQRWTATDRLATQLSGTGWNNNRRVVTWNPDAGEGAAFRHAELSSAQQTALDTPYRTGADSQDYVNYIRGDRTHERGSTATGSSQAYRARTRLLGDIAGSKARPVGAPAMPYSNAANPGYTNFRTTYASRPTVVYVGANDGMMHAFNGALSGTGSGNEIFAYVPSAVIQGPSGTPGVDGLAALGNPDFVHHHYVNATPQVFDIDFRRTPGAAEGTPDWRSVLIGGLGKGGRSYYAIDVTNPATMTTEEAVASRVLWEFTDPDLGFTYGDPVVVKTRKYGWTVILPSGYNNADGQGYLFFVNPRTGELLEKVSTGVGASNNQAGMAHAAAFVLDLTDGVADAVYAGDLLGNVWRFDITQTSGSYPAPTRLASLTTTGGAVQPVTTKPLIEVQPNTNRRFVMIGTGRLLHDSDIASTQTQTFYAIADGTGSRFNRPANLPSGVSFPITRSNMLANIDPLVGVAASAAAPMGWYIDLGNGAQNIGWRVIADPTTFFGVVAFASTLPNGDACSPSGSSRVYAIDFGTGRTVLTNNGVATIYSSVIAGVVTDLRFLSVDGQSRLIGGSDQGEVRAIEGQFGSGTGLRRLNWRELPLVQ